MKIQAAVVREQSGPFDVSELDLAEPKDDEVLVKIVGVGICHTDLVCRDQYFPVPLPCVFGHEGSGIIEKVGRQVVGFEKGDHVAVSYKTCGSCEPCLQGQIGYCHGFYEHNFNGTRPDGSSALSENGETVHGHFFAQSSFASHALCHASNLVKVDHSLPLELLGPLGCGIQTGAGAVMNALKPQAGTSIAIFGAGTVGLSAVMAAHIVGCGAIIAIDLKDDRLATATELGATHTINASDNDVVAKIHEITGSGTHFSLECTGIPQVARQAVDCLTLTGICGVLGVSPAGTEFSLDMNAVLFGRSVRGIIEGDSVPQVFIPRLIDLYKQGRFPFDKLISTYSFADINQAVEDVESGKVIKPVLLMDA
jgi:aryl-alcohol dehydrogenase